MEISPFLSKKLQIFCFMKKLSFDSTSSIKGIIFQFLIALERCFNMQEGQSVYIERLGDVSVIGKMLTSGRTKDGTNTHLVPFDKSASMSRKSVITFIDDSLKERMDERLNMGLLLPGKPYPLSKVFAYRGLYLSDGVRIKEEEDYFFLDEHSVVVIPDVKSKTRKNGIKVFTETTAYDEENHLLPEYGEVSYMPKSKNQFEVNCFDGEGFIDDEYAEKLSVSLGYKEHSCTSFQIRLPFGKGMLHKVDFHKFCKNEFKIGNGDYIRDAFGIPRKIGDIHIVLTESMFKAYKWMKKAYPGKDPMQEYFKRFHDEYQHGLYIVRTNMSLVNPGYVNLNYQFLNTGKLKQSEFSKLIEESLSENVVPLRTDEDVQRSFIRNGVSSKIDDGENPGEDEKEDKTINENLFEKFSEVLKEHPEMIAEKKIHGMLQGAVVSCYLDAMRGNLMVRGENRFLSGDLLYLLRSFAHLCIVEANRVKKDVKCGNVEKTIAQGTITPTTYLVLGQIKNPSNPFEKTERAHEFYEKLRKQSLYKRFYAPSRKGGVDYCPDKYYAVLRNPHLSRNEQCALNPYVINKIERESNLYYKYFQHLTGVIMLPYGSENAERLGGADFDGDMVKIYDQSDLNESAKKSYDEKSLVQIPHTTEKDRPYEKQIRYSQIKDGFDSQVGRLSNIAIKLGELQYNENVDKDQKLVLDKDYAAISCILVGQEIDKVKNGVPPYTSEVTGKSNELKDYTFIDRKNDVSKFKNATLKKTELKDKHDTETPKKQYVFSKKDFEKTIDEPNQDVPNLESLMYRVADFWYEEQRKNNAVKPKMFKVKKVRKGKRNEESFTKLGLIMLAYNRVIQTAKNDNEWRQRFKKANYYPRVLNTLNVQYDNLTKPIKLNEGVYGGINQVYRLADNLYKADPEKVREALKTIISDHWQYTKPEERKNKIDSFFPEEAFGEQPYKDYKSDLEKAETLLSNFNQRGYHLLYYILKDTIRMRAIIENFENEDFSESEMEVENAKYLGSLAADSWLKKCKSSDKKAGKKAMTYLAGLAVSIFRTSEEIQKKAEFMNGKKMSVKTLHDDVFEMKAEFQESVSEADAEAFPELLKQVIECMKVYEQYAEKYEAKFQDIHNSKRDVNEDGTYSDSSWKAEVVKIIREDILELFPDSNEPDAVSYWYEHKKIDSNHDFFWDVFTAQEINKSLAFQRKRV